MNSFEYLQMMGISQWRLRTVKPVFYYRYVFYEDGQMKPVGYLLADANLMNEAEQQLVVAIAKAIKKKFMGECVTDLNIANFAQTRVIILLGERVINTLTPEIGEHPSVASYSLAELLANPSLKAKTWEAIKKAMQMM